MSVVQPPPPQISQPVPNPNVAQNAGELFQAQLQYNPQLTQQSVELQGKYGPELAQQQYALQQQYGPLYRQLYEQLFPSQTQGLETLAQQSLQRLQSPESLTPQQQALQDALRNRSREQIQRNVRQSSNLGGTLFGGARQEREDEALRQFESGNLQSDLQRQLQQRSQALQELIAAQQVIFPQVQQVGVPQFGQGVTPSPDALMNAIQQNYLATPAAIGYGPSPFSQNAALWGGLGQGALGAFGAMYGGGR